MPTGPIQSIAVIMLLLLIRTGPRIERASKFLNIADKKSTDATYC